MAEPTAAIGAAAILFILFIFMIPLIFFVLIILATVFWVFMIVDVAKRDFKNENDKIMWILIVVLAGIIGALIYYFLVKKHNKH